MTIYWLKLSYGSYYASLVRVLVWLSEAVTEIFCKKIVVISMKKTFKNTCLKDFILRYRFQACNLVKNKLHRYFLRWNWCYWSASAGLFAILWFTVFQNTLLAASAISLELFQKLWKCIAIQYPKKFSKKAHTPKNVSAGWKMKSNIFPTSFPYLKKCFKILEIGVHKNVTLIFLWPKIGALRVKVKEETFPWTGCYRKVLFFTFRKYVLQKTVTENT